MKTFEGKLVSQNIKVGIVAARFNEFITSKLLSGAMDGLLRHDVQNADEMCIRDRLYQCQLPEDPDWLPTYRCRNSHHLSTALAAEHPFTCLLYTSRCV